MGKVILYGMIESPPVRAVLLTFKALDLDHEFRIVNLMTGEHLTPEFQEKNPQHTVPVLEDNGKWIWDSHAICIYLIGKYGKQDDPLYPKDLYKRALIDQRLHFDSGILFPALRAIAEGIFFRNDPNISPDKLEAIDKAYDFLEKFLSVNSYLVENSITLADFCCIATVTSLKNLRPIDGNKYPKLTAWTNRLTQLPYYEEANGKGAASVGEMLKNKIKSLTEA